MKDAQKAGISLQLVSGYVSPEEQNEEYEKRIEEYRKDGYTQVRAEDKAQNSLGMGGYSESQTGLSVVFASEEGKDLKDTLAYQWLLDHSVEYGFVQRFPENKTDETGRDFSPGCYRYVGQEHALNMRRLSMCLEEYLSLIHIFNRPLINTEWLHRPFRSLIQTHLPLWKKEGVGSYFFGFVNGKSQFNICLLYTSRCV